MHQINNGYRLLMKVLYQLHIQWLLYNWQDIATGNISCFPYCYCQHSIPAVNFLLNPEGRNYNQLEPFILYIKDFSESTIFNLPGLLIILDTLDSLSNGASNYFMFHQKYYLNRKKPKTRFKSRNQIWHN